MKKLILMAFIFSASFAFCGDGTLPVIRNIQIDFIPSGIDLGGKLPECIVVGVNKKIKDKSSVTKNVVLNAANLEQIIKLTNENGDLAVDVFTQLLQSQAPLSSNRRDLNDFEFMNELNLGGGTLVQHIQINSDQLNAHCLRR